MFLVKTDKENGVGTNGAIKTTKQKTINSCLPQKMESDNGKSIQAIFFSKETKGQK